MRAAAPMVGTVIVLLRFAVGTSQTVSGRSGTPKTENHRDRTPDPLRGPVFDIVVPSGDGTGEF